MLTTAITIYLSGYILAMLLIRYLNINYYAYDCKTSLLKALILSLLSYIAVAAMVLVLLEIAITRSDVYENLSKKFTE